MNNKLFECKSVEDVREKFLEKDTSEKVEEGLKKEFWKSLDSELDELLESAVMVIDRVVDPDEKSKVANKVKIFINKKIESHFGYFV